MIVVQQRLLVIMMILLLLISCSSEGSLPSLKPKLRHHSVPQFSDIPAGQERKKAFIAFLNPIIVEENKHVVSIRKAALELIDKKSKGTQLNAKEVKWLSKLANHYKINSTIIDDKKFKRQLQKKVDIVPASLAIAQASIESGWGTSRFAKKGHNYYGQWCYTPNCGLIPKNRKKSAVHKVKKFENPAASVRAYLHNINTHRSYHQLREKRFAERQNKKMLTGIALASGLDKYSERGAVYTQEVAKQIQHNKLVTYDIRYL